MNVVVKKWTPNATPESIALGASLALLLAAILLPLWLVPGPTQRLDVWLYSGAALAPLTLAAVIGCVVIGRRRVELALDPEGFYRALEIDPRSSQGMAEEEIQALVVRQYRSLARRCHPDVAKDGERMRLINRAYQELKDPTRRQRYSRGAAA